MGPGAALAVLFIIGYAQAQYVGKPLGALSELHHGVRGRVFAVDSRTIYLQDFHYDGEGPAAYFYVGKSGRPSAAGVRLRDERGGAGPLRRYRGEGAALALPDGLTLKDIRWFAIWCDEFSVNFGDITIPRDVEFPRPARVGALRGVHGVSSDAIVVVDAQTLLVPNFSYDGEAPDAKFWVGRGDKPSPQGIRIPDENGKEAPLRKYDKKTIVLTLPGELTVFDIGHFSVWCEAFTVNFGHVTLPHAALSNVPPSLKMLGVSPQSKLNCEVLLDDLAFEVRWAVAGDSIVLQLVAKLEDGEYMSFGISGDGNSSQMVGADVAVAWVDKATLKGYAQDYYLDAKSQCAGVRGSCPDERLGEKTNSIRLLNAALVNGYSIVTYQRSLRAADELDRPVLTNGSQPVVWALGPLNSRQEVSYHHHFTKGDRFIEFGRPPLWNCPMPEGEDEPRPTPSATRSPPRPQEVAQEAQPVKEVAPTKQKPVPTPRPVPRAVPWEIPGIQCYEPPDGVFYAQMGPTGGKQGYSAITGHVGWGISWYINGLLIPEITVVRGKKYTFVVEGGSDPETPARYHPFYITNDPVGGYYHKTDEERKNVEIYAGVRRARNGEPIPTGVGRLCNWTPDENGPPADDYPSFGAYQRSLTLVCEEGSPGLVTWTPNERTPDTVYYQCFTHRYLGWKIRVVDECDYSGEGEGQESRVVESVVPPPADMLESDPLEPLQQESIQVSTRIAPDADFLDHRKKIEKIINTKTNNFSSDRDAPERPENEVVTRGQIRDVIAAVEDLEARMRKNSSQPQLQQNRHQYLVHEEPERAVRDGDELSAQPAPHHFLPPIGRPLTLQSVLRPRQPPLLPYRRPSPPELSIMRPRPPPSYQPLPSYQQQLPHNKPGKPMFGQKRRPPMPPNKQMLPMKPMAHSKPFVPPKQVQKYRPAVTQVYPMQSIVMGKPTTGKVPSPSSHTLNVGRTDLIANQVVRGQITLPGAGDSISAQSGVRPTFVNQPGQIILGKPMDHPVPLDQQMTPTKQVVITAPPPFESTTPRYRQTLTETPETQQQGEIKSSDFMGESTDPPTLRPAINTGFKPNTIVIESGFKPIIREPLMDRLGGDYDASVNRRQDTDVEDDYEEAPQPLVHQSNAPTEKKTESFEPMFIPSPPDLLLPSDDRTKEVFPKNHAKEDRPHPVYVKTESELNALFSKKNMEKEVPSDLVMESDRVSPQYLPPDPKLPKEHSQKLSEGETFTTYDGKTVSAVTLTGVSDSKPNTKIFSSKLPSNSEFLLKTPQFGPFKGEIPPAVAGSIAKASDADIFDEETTHLKLVNAFKPDEHEAEPKAEGSEKKEVKVKPSDSDDTTAEVDDKKDEIKDASENTYDDEEIQPEDDEDMRSMLEEARGRRHTGKKLSRQTRGTNNQIDFQVQTSSSPKLLWTSLLILPLLIQLF